MRESWMRLMQGGMAITGKKACGSSKCWSMSKITWIRNISQAGHLLILKYSLCSSPLARHQMAKGHFFFASWHLDNTTMRSPFRAEQVGFYGSRAIRRMRGKGTLHVGFLVNLCSTVAQCPRDTHVLWSSRTIGPRLRYRPSLLGRRSGSGRRSESKYRVVCVES